jgi:phosphonate transport system permease protein
MTPAQTASWRARVPRAFAAAPATRALRLAASLAAAAWLLALLWWFDLTPVRFWNGLSGLWKIVRLMIPPSPGQQWPDILQGLGESVAMAFLGSTLALLAAIPLSLLGARNIVTSGLAHFTLRRFFDGLRGMDQLIWALAFVRAFGLGPLAGVLAIAASEIAILAKLFAEALENADPRQADGIESTGATQTLRIRFGLIPQVLPVMLAQYLYQIESNTRSAAVLGVVGAGGIGLQIAERIKVRYWDEVAFIILLILATVMTIDAISARVRRRLIGG